MPWLINHACRMGQSPQPYAIQLVGTPEEPMTKVRCVGECREEFTVVGDDMFAEAKRSNELGKDLPPGFVIARSHVSG